MFADEQYSVSAGKPKDRRPVTVANRNQRTERAFGVHHRPAGGAALCWVVKRPCKTALAQFDERWRQRPLQRKERRSN